MRARCLHWLMLTRAFLARTVRISLLWAQLLRSDLDVMCGFSLLWGGDRPVLAPLCAEGCRDDLPSGEVKKIPRAQKAAGMLFPMRFG